MAKNMRLHELARELGVSDAQLFDLCERMGVGVKGPTSTLIEAQADRLRRRAKRDGLNHSGHQDDLSRPTQAPTTATRLGSILGGSRARRAQVRVQPSAAESITAEQLARALRVDVQRLLKVSRENGIGLTGPRSLVRSQDRAAVERLFQQNSPVVGAAPSDAGSVARLALATDERNGNRTVSSTSVVRRWSELEKSVGSATSFEGSVVELVKGGMIIDLGVRAFLPASLVDRHPVSVPHDWLGRRLEVEVIEADAGRNKLIVSRRRLLDRRAKAAEAAFYATAEAGEIRDGRVVAIKDRGVLFEVAGVEVFVKERELGKPLRDHAEGESVPIAICDLDRELCTVVASTRVQSLPAGPSTELLLELPEAPGAGVRAVDGRLLVDIAAIENGALDRVLVEAGERGHTSVLVVLAGESDGSKRLLRHAIKSGAFSGVEPARCRQTSDGFSVALRVVPPSAQQGHDRDGWGRQVG